MDQEVFERAFAVAAELERAGLPQGVQAVTVGYKRSGGATTEQPALIFLVDRKLPVEKLAPAMHVPPQIGGFSTDVVEMQAVPHVDGPGAYERVEPLVGGVSIKADFKSGIGTLGAIFCNKSSRQPMGLTNRHVVDNWFINANGQMVFQPTETRENRIGAVWQHSKVWDCAAVAIDLASRKVDRERSFLGAPGRIHSIGRALVNMPVLKFGARTGRTSGVVKSSGPSAVEIRPEDGRAGTEISDQGDSGSVWVSETRDGYVALALHWGGSEGVALAKPMIEVAKTLDLDVLDEPGR